MEYEQIPAKELRRLYVKATLRQRYRVAINRIDSPHIGPSLLVNVVSALEGFARAVALRSLVQRGMPIKQAYNCLRNIGPIVLIREHICRAYNVAPKTAFGDDAWAQLPDAVAFRNLLVHEATYLHGGTCNRLIAASRHILDTLAQMAGACGHRRPSNRRCSTRRFQVQLVPSRAALAAACLIPSVALLAATATSSGPPDRFHAEEPSYSCTIENVYGLAPDATLQISAWNQDAKGSRFVVSRLTGQIIGDWLPTLNATSVEVLRPGDDEEWAFHSAARFDVGGNHNVQIVHIEQFRKGPRKPFVAAALGGFGIFTGHCELR